MTDHENRVPLICAASTAADEHAVPAGDYWTLIIGGTVERYCDARCLEVAQQRRYHADRREPA